MRSLNIQHFDPRAIARDTKEALHLEVTSTPAGLPVYHTVLTVGGKEPGPLLVLSGGVHGDEYEGPLTIMRLFQELTPADIKGTLVGLVVANVPAFEAAARCSPVDGLNLARVFPGDPNGSVTRQIAFWMGERLIGRADFYIDFHSSGSDIEMPTLCGYHVGTGPAAELRRRVAEAFHAPVCWAHPYDPTALGRAISYAYEHDVPCLYTECPASRRVDLADVAIFMRGVRNTMRVLGMLDGELEGEPAKIYLWGEGNIDTALSTRTAGFFQPARELLDWVEPGELLGNVFDLAGNVLEELRAPSSGYVTLRQLLPLVHAGTVVFMLTGKPPE